MWQLDLTEEEFYLMRSEQNLLVDFANFPYKLIELLQKCLSFPISEPAASFFAQLTLNQSGEGTAILSFIERTSFRQVNQLSLKLKSVESDVLKKKLSELLKNYREQINSLQSQISSGYNYNTPLNTTSNYSGGNNFKGTNTNTSNPINTSINTNANVHNANAANANVHNLAAGALVREKDEACAHLNQLYEVTKEAKGRIEEENQEYKREIEGLKGQFQESQGEVQKANEIITKLQDEVRGLKAKLKSASSIADDQMNAAEQLRLYNKRLQAEYTEVAEKAHSAKNLSEALERDNKALKSQIEQLEKAVQQRDAIIVHHQRQSNVKDLDRAIRSLDLAVSDQGISGDDGALSNQTTNEFSFESTGYVGSRIFDQTF